MIVKISVLALTLCIDLLCGVSGASFSKVFVHSGQESVPVEYIQYGAPTVSIPGPQIAQISAAPVGSVVPVASSPNVIPPCGIPCIYQGQAISSAAHFASATPNFVTYKSNVPVVLKNSEEPNGYEYSYFVYDEDTGDHKAQHELSDGGVVRGEYSLIQPDGYVRQVHYTADDIKGFNAIVKKFLPVNVVTKDEHTEENHPSPPCHEVDHESLKSSEPHEKHEENHHKEPHSDEENHEMHETASSDERHEETHNPESHEHSKEKSSGGNHESIEEEHPGHTNKENHGNPSEALTEASSKSNEEKEGRAEEHESTPHHEDHKVEAQDEHDQHHETFESKEHETKDEPHHDVIKCVQTAINSKNQIPAPLTYIILNNPC